MDVPVGKDWNWALTSSGGPSMVPVGFHPLADIWSDIAHREQSVGIPEGQPILLSATAIDYRLGDYFREAFRADRGSTARTYASELRTWFRFLDRRSLTWDESGRNDVRAFQVWRVYDDRNPRPVSPATWNKGWAALSHFYDWAHRKGLVPENPVGERDRLRDPNQPTGYREKNSRSSRDRWILPSEFSLWREVGFRSYFAERDSSGRVVATTVDEWARPRNGARNSAFANYLITTGLRLNEAGSLLRMEIPSQVDEEVPIVVKGGKRRHYRVQNELGLQGVDAYLAERNAAVRSAQRSGRYEEVSERLEIVRTHGGTGDQSLQLNDGRVLKVADMRQVDRTRLFFRDGELLEPAWLWLTDAGMPMKPASWGKVFAAANERVTTARAALGIRSPGVKVTPHSLRFTIALLVLLAGVRAIDEELGIGKAGAFFVRNYTQAFDEVQHLLGHNSRETTRSIYLEPLKGLRRSSLLSGISLEEMWAGLVGPRSLVGFRSAG
jgi:site-specific recombinase XerD